ncbi:uncharacterized protein DUF664 [Kribbella orskensis]|uniref:Uncharacterized protein DUF664 n=1 Tax=Kribbella orskensis TaxID=2512216 RepID=A0ABY2B968_9ACTN|nr:uncharacterized protein DUF664 [Kribbella sp. VKM Ac-2500]TCO10064.1 uncharacterized protein DUF664 [Kribbella orskensis]
MRTNGPAERSGHSIACWRLRPRVRPVRSLPWSESTRRFFMLSTKLSGAPMATPWDTADWDGDPDWDFNPAADDTPDQLYAIWDSTIERSREKLDATLADGGLDQLVYLAWSDGSHLSLRRLVCDLIEEYGRAYTADYAQPPATPARRLPPPGRVQTSDHLVRRCAERVVPPHECGWFVGRGCGRLPGVGGWFPGVWVGGGSRSPLRDGASRAGVRQERFASLRDRNKFRLLTHPIPTREGRSYADPAEGCEPGRGGVFGVGCTGRRRCEPVRGGVSGWGVPTDR